MVVSTETKDTQPLLPSSQQQASPGEPTVVSTTSTTTATTPSGEQHSSPHLHDDVIHHDHDHPATITRVVALSIDASEHSRYAFEWTLANFIDPSRDLVVLMHSRPVASAPGPYGSMYVDFTEYINEVEEQYRMDSHKLLRTYAIELKKQQIACKAIAMRGDARENIIRKTKEINANILILGSRGLGTIKRALIGSVSDYCVHNCHCPVVIVKKNDI